MYFFEKSLYFLTYARSNTRHFLNWYITEGQTASILIICRNSYNWLSLYRDCVSFFIVRTTAGASLDTHTFLDVILQHSVSHSIEPRISDIYHTYITDDLLELNLCLFFPVCLAEQGQLLPSVSVVSLTSSLPLACPQLAQYRLRMHPKS
jgi:hypothetical protein